MTTNPESNDKDWENLAKMAFPKPDVKGSEAFVQRVMARIEEEEAKSFWRHFAWPQWTLAGAGALALGAFFLLPSHQPTPKPISHETTLVAHSFSEWDLLEPSEDQTTIGTTIEEYFL
jgi:hypothetical protein